MKTHEIKAIKTSILAILFVAVSLALWSMAIQFTDVAPLVLLPLFVILYQSTYRLQLDLWRAHYELIVKSDSVLYNLINGKVRAHLGALIFSLSSVPVIAWFFITADVALLGTLGFIIAAACITYFSFKSSLRIHFKEPFATKYAINFATVIGAGVSFIVLWWYAWAVDLHAAEFQSVDLIGAVEIGKSGLPNSSSIFAPIFTIPFVLEAVKLWIVVKLKNYSFLALILSLEAALVGFLIAKLSVMATFFVDKLFKDNLNE